MARILAQGGGLGRAALPWLLLGGLFSPPAVAADLYGGGSDLEAEQRALLASPDPEKRRQGIEQLAGLEPRLAVPHLLIHLRDADASVRARAAHVIGPSAVEDAVPQLLAGLSDSDSSVRSACAEALGQFGALPADATARAVVVLGRALGDSQYEVRMEALRAIERLFHAGVLGQSEAKHLLSPVLLRSEDEHVGVRRAAVAVLGRLGPLALPSEFLRRAVVALLGRLSDSARDVRAEALVSLSALGAAEGGSAALRLLQDPAEEVRRQALLYLGSIAYAAAVPLLVEAFESGSEGLRPAAAQSLSGVARAAGDNKGALLALVAALQRDEARSLARDSLLQIGAKAVPLLLARLQKSSTGQAEVSAVVDLLRDLALGISGGPLSPAPLAAAQRQQIVDELFAELRRGRLPREQVVDALSAAAPGVPSSARLLVGLLSEPEAVVRRHVVAGLRQPGLVDARALDALFSATRDSDREVRTQATLLLAEVPNRAAIQRLLSLLQGNDPELRLAATQALGLCVQRSSAQLGAAEGGSVVAALVAALALPGDGLGELRSRRAAALALGQVVTAMPALRAQAVTAVSGLFRRGHAAEAVLPEAVAALGNLLRGGAILSLPGAQAEAVRKTLLDLATASADADSSEAVLALDALDALGAIGDTGTAARIARLLSHRDPLRRVRAAAALGNLLGVASSDSQAATPLAALLTTLKEDSDARVLAEAAWALGKLPRSSGQAARVGTPLRRLLARREGGVGPGDSVSFDRAIRINALAALTRLGQAEVGDAQWLSDADSGVRANSALLLSALPSLSSGMQARLHNLENSDEDHRVRNNAARALHPGTKAGAPGAAGKSDHRHFLTMFQLDHDRKPLAEAAYRLTLPDGVVRAGITDRRGIAREEQLPAGKCEVELLSEL